MAGAGEQAKRSEHDNTNTRGHKDGRIYNVVHSHRDPTREQLGAVAPAALFSEASIAMDIARNMQWGKPCGIASQAALAAGKIEVKAHWAHQGQ